MKNLTTLFISSFFLTTLGFGQPALDVHTITTSVSYATSVFSVDIDSDGDMDVLSASEGSSMEDDKIAWYENDGSECFTAHNIATGFRFLSVYVVDVDVDGVKVELQCLPLSLIIVRLWDDI